MPSDAVVNNSYNNKYSGLEQYTVNASLDEAMAMVYGDYQKILQDAGYTLGKSTSSDKVDTINATQGSNYITVQLTPQSPTITNIVANYGVPSASTSAAASSSTASSTTPKSK